MTTLGVGCKDSFIQKIVTEHLLCARPVLELHSEQEGKILALMELTFLRVEVGGQTINKISVCSLVKSAREKDKAMMGNKGHQGADWGTILNTVITTVSCCCHKIVV